MMKSLKDLIFTIYSFATIIHIASDFENFLDSFRIQVLTFSNHSRKQNEFRKVSPPCAS